MNYTPADRQYLIRTVLGEAANQPDDGKAGVAHVILNRMKKRGAKDVRSIVTAKHQFEPWNDPAARSRMLAYKEDDPVYQQAAQVVDGVLSGNMPDPTGGADHFLNADVVRQRRGGSLPSWADQMWDTRQKIGDHTFLGGSGAATMQGSEGGYTLEQLMAEKARRQQAPSPQGEYTLDQLLAEKTRRQGGAPAPVETMPAPAEEPRNEAEAATTIVNDLNAGFQGVNPVSVAKSQPLGVVERDADGNVAAISVDGLREDPSKYPSSQFVTQTDPKTGLEIVYRRTEENDDSPLASAGRILGAAIPTAFPNGKVATAPIPNAAKAIGVTPSLGMTGRTGAMAAGAGDAFIGTGGVMARDAARASDEISAAAGRIADSAGPGVNAVDGGGALQKGADEFVDAFTAKSRELYAEVDKAIPKNARVEVRNTAVALEDALTLFKDTPNIGGTVGLSKLTGWAEDILANGGQIPWETVKALRSEIGGAIGKMKGPLADQADARLKTLYGALTDDMAAGAKANGALGPWLRANTFYAKGQKRIGEALDVVFKSKSEEQIFDRVFKLTADKGGKANIGKLNGLKKSMPPEEWSSFVGTVIRRMGKPGTGSATAADGTGFSADTFLNAWNTMAPAARSVLFKGKGLPKTLAPALDQLAEVAGDAKKAGLEINRSRSGGVAAQLATGGALATAPIPTVLTLMVANLGARAITQPGVIRAVASFGKTGKLDGLQRLAASKGPAAVEASNMLRLATQSE